ncbi:MAG TPA: hypothetical protein VN154_08925 [Rhizomicrobium sp.]|nr:hypothetical protein [Rhizomicrobium sp.]
MYIAVTGLGREARIVSRPDITTLVGGGDMERLRNEIISASQAGARRILSIGICGALSPALQVGDCIVATEVVTLHERIPTHGAWTKELLESIPDAQPGAIAGADAIVADSVAKSRLFESTKADAADMESHVAAATARSLGLPFAAVRVVSDASHHSLPHAAVVAMAPTGEVDYPAVLRSLFRRPAQIPALIRTAFDAEKAFRVLFRCRHVLAPSLVRPSLGELSLDMT